MVNSEKFQWLCTGAGGGPFWVKCTKYKSAAQLLSGASEEIFLPQKIAVCGKI